jgi:hypothetical protein
MMRFRTLQEHGMYGLINRAVKGLVTEQFGIDAWNRIRSRAGVQEEDFISMESYDDSVTYDLVAAASEELGLSAETILEAFGSYWVEYTAVEGYGELLDSAGKTLPEFLANLDQMHARVKLAFPDLKPPRFRISDSTDSGLTLHYFSHRPGLSALVTGLVKGLASRFGREVEVTPFRTGEGEEAHDAFKILYVGTAEDVVKR